LWSLSGGFYFRMLLGHKKPVRACAFSPDGQYLLSASYDGTAKLWIVTDGKKEHILHSNHIEGPGTGGADGSCLATMKAHNGMLRCCAFAPEGKECATGGDDTQIYIWNVPSGKKRLSLSDHSGAVMGCSYSPDGKLFASVSRDSSIRIFNRPQMKVIKVLKSHASHLLSCTFGCFSQLLATSGDLLAISSEHNPTPDGIRLWDTNNGEDMSDACVAKLQGHDMSIFAVDFSPVQQLLVSGSHDASIKFWDLDQGIFERADASRSISPSPYRSPAPAARSEATRIQEIEDARWIERESKTVVATPEKVSRSGGSYDDSKMAEREARARASLAKKKADHDETSMSSARITPRRPSITASGNYNSSTRRSSITVDVRGRKNLLRDIFREFDLDNGGSIDSSELLELGKARRSLGQKASTWTEEKNARLVRKIDSNRDGDISESEFVNFFEDALTKDANEFEATILQFMAVARACRRGKLSKRDDDAAALRDVIREREARLQMRQCSAETTPTKSSGGDPKMAEREARARAALAKKKVDHDFTSPKKRDDDDEMAVREARAKAAHAKRIADLEEEDRPKSPPRSPRAPSPRSRSASPRSTYESADKRSRRARLMDVFREFDLDQGGSVETEELMHLGKARRRLGQKTGDWTEERNNRLMRTMDVNGDGEISGSEFTLHFDNHLPQDAEQFDIIIEQFLMVARACRADKVDRRQEDAARRQRDTVEFAEREARAKAKHQELLMKQEREEAETRRRQQEEDEARMRRREEAMLQKKREEEEAQREEEEARRRQQEENEARMRRREEAMLQKKKEEEAQTEEEEARRRQQEEDEAIMRRREGAMLQKQREEEEVRRRRHEEDEERMLRDAELKLREIRAREAFRLKQEAEEGRLKAEAEETAVRLKAKEEAASLKAKEEAARLKAQADAIDPEEEARKALEVHLEANEKMMSPKHADQKKELVAILESPRSKSPRQSPRPISPRGNESPRSIRRRELELEEKKLAKLLAKEGKATPASPRASTQESAEAEIEAMLAGRGQALGAASPKSLQKLELDNERAREQDELFNKGEWDKGKKWSPRSPRDSSTTITRTVVASPRRIGTAGKEPGSSTSETGLLTHVDPIPKQKLGRWFRKMDADSDCGVTLGEMNSQMPALASEFNLNLHKLSRVSQVFDMMDSNQDAKLDCDEFEMMLQVCHAAQQQAQEILNSDTVQKICFELMDIDKNGTIDKAEMLKRMSALQGVLGMRDTMDKANAVRLFELADKDESGSLDYEEFCQMLSRLQKIMREQQSLKRFKKVDESHQGKWFIGDPELARRCANLLEALDFNKSGVVAGRQLSENLPTVYRMLEQAKENVSEEDARAAYENDPQSQKIKMVKFDIESLQELAAHILNDSVNIQERKTVVSPKSAKMEFTKEKTVTVSVEMDDVGQQISQQVSMPKFEKQWKILDTDNDGLLNKESLKELVCWISGKPNDPRASAEVTKLLSVTNQDPDRGLSLEQFRRSYGAQASPIGSPRMRSNSRSPKSSFSPKSTTHTIASPSTLPAPPRSPKQTEVWPPTKFTKVQSTVGYGANKTSVSFDAVVGMTEKVAALNTDEGRNTNGSIASGLVRLCSQPQEYEALQYQTEMLEWPEAEQCYKIYPRLQGANMVVDSDPTGEFTMLHLKADPNGTADGEIENTSSGADLSPRAAQEKKYWRCFNAMDKDASGTRVLKKTLRDNASSIYQTGGYEQVGCSLAKMSQLIQSTTGKDGHGQTEMTDDGLDFAGFKDYLVTLQQIASAGSSSSWTSQVQNQDGTVEQWSYKTEETESMVNRLQNETAAADAQAEQTAQLANLVNTPKFKQRFDSLDIDGSGFLDPQETEELARWIYGTFTKSNKMLDDEQIKIESAKLIRKLDKNKDGQIRLDEFREFFNKKAKQAAKFTAAAKKKGVEHVDLLNDEIVARSHLAAPRATSPRAESPQLAASPRAASPCPASPTELAAIPPPPADILPANGHKGWSCNYSTKNGVTMYTYTITRLDGTTYTKDVVVDAGSGSDTPRAASPRAASPLLPDAMTAQEEAAMTRLNAEMEAPAQNEFEASPKSPKKALSIEDVNWHDPASVALFEEGVKAAQRAGTQESAKAEIEEMLTGRNQASGAASPKSLQK